MTSWITWCTYRATVSSFFWFPALLLPTQSNHTLHIIIIAANRLLTMQRISGLNSFMSHIACYFFSTLSLSLKTKSLRLPHIPSLFCHHILLVSCPSVFARSSLWVARPGSCLCQASIKPISCEGSDPPRSYLLPCGLRKKKKERLKASWAWVQAAE